MAKMTHAIADGAGVARRAWPVPLILWVWTLLVAGPATMPFFMWLRGELAAAPEGDALLQRFRFDLFAELTRSAEGAAWSAIGGAVFAMLAVAVVGRAFVIGGLVETLSAGSDGPVLRRFFGGGGRWFLPNLAVLVINGVATAVVVLMASMVGGIAGTLLAETLSPVLAWIGLLLPIVLAGVVLLFFVIVYDYACIRVAQQLGIWRAWLGALLFAARRIFSVVGLWLAAALLTIAVAAVYLGIRNVAPATTWPLILLMAVLQQLFVLTRAWLRTAVVAAEISYAPPVQAAPVVQPEPVAWPEPVARLEPAEPRPEEGVADDTVSR